VLPPPVVRRRVARPVLRLGCGLGLVPWFVGPVGLVGRRSRSVVWGQEGGSARREQRCLHGGDGYKAGVKWDILCTLLGALGLFMLVAGPFTGRRSLTIAGVVIGVVLNGYAYWLWRRHRDESPRWQYQRAVRSWFRRAQR
jgi:hypothetical protein